MRGIDATQSAMFSYVSPERRIPKDHPLRLVRALCDIALKALSREFERMYSDIGRPSVPPERLLRALLLQILYTIRTDVDGATGLQPVVPVVCGTKYGRPGMGCDGLQQKPGSHVGVGDSRIVL